MNNFKEWLLDQHFIYFNEKHGFFTRNGKVLTNIDLLGYKLEYLRLCGKINNDIYKLVCEVK